MIELALSDGTAEAYLPGFHRSTQSGVLMFMDVIGLRPELERIADRVASWGYTVVVPNLLYPFGSAAELAAESDLTCPEQREAFMASMGPRVKSLTPQRTHALTRELLDQLRGNGVLTGGVGTVGFCMGARFATVAAGLDPEVVAVAGFHGDGLVTPDPLSPHRSIPASRVGYLYARLTQA